MSWRLVRGSFEPSSDASESTWITARDLDGLARAPLGEPLPG